MSNDGQDDKNVNNYKEKQKDTHDLQVLNAIGYIIARMHAASSVATLQEIRNSAQNIKSDDPRIHDIIKKVQEVVLRKELIEENKLNSEQMQKALEELAELEKQRQWEENEIRKSRLAINLKAYDELIENGFHEELKQDTKLLEKASQDWDSLSEEEQKKISRHGLSKDEKAKLEEEDRQKSAKINLAHQLEEDAEKTKKFSQVIIDKNTKKYGDNPTKIPTDIKKANDDHRQVIADCNEAIKKVQPVHIERENQRKALLEIAKQNPKIVEEQVKLHYRNYKSKYEQLKQDDPNHRGSDELNKLIELCGGHEKLGLDNPNIVTNSKEQLAHSDSQLQKVSHYVENSILSKYPPGVYQEAAKLKNVIEQQSRDTNVKESKNKIDDKQKSGAQGTQTMKTFAQRKKEKASKSII